MEAFAHKGEKNMLKSMFSNDGDDVSTDDDNSKRPAAHDDDDDDDAEDAAADNEDDVGSGIENNELSSPSPLDDDQITIEVYKSRDTSNPFEIRLQQEKRKGIAHQLWPAAVLLSEYIEQNIDRVFGPVVVGAASGTGSGALSLLPPPPPTTTTPKPSSINVIELGAGIGLCGLVCGALGFKKVVLTDLPCAITSLETNIQLNSSTRVEAHVLKWGDADDLAAVMNRFTPGEPILCIAADCVYWEVLFQPLYETIKALVLKHGVDVLIAHVKRWKKDEKFFRMVRKGKMDVELLSETRALVPHEHTGVPMREIRRVYRIKRSAGGGSASGSRNGARGPLVANAAARNGASGSNATPRGVGPSGNPSTHLDSDRSAADAVMVPSNSTVDRVATTGSLVTTIDTDMLTIAGYDGGDRMTMRDLKEGQ